MAAVVPGLAGLAMLLTALLMQGLKGIKTAHVLCVCLFSVEYVDKQRTFQTGNALHIFKNETSLLFSRLLFSVQSLKIKM